MELGRLYFIGNIGEGKVKHLAYINRFEDLVHTLCLPNIPVYFSWDCESKKAGDLCEAGRNEAEEWDNYFSEVTCPTCLRMAKGK